MSFPENYPEVDERVPEMERMYAMEKEIQMFVEWQQWEDEQSKIQLPAKVEMLTPIPESNEVKSDSFSF